MAQINSIADDDGLLQAFQNLNNVRFGKYEDAEVTVDYIQEPTSEVQYRDSPLVEIEITLKYSLTTRLADEIIAAAKEDFN